MNQLLRILKPTPLAILLMVFALAVVGIVSCSYVTYGSTERAELSIGIGGPIKIITEGKSKSTQIHWLLLLAQLAVVYLTANRAAIDLVRVTRFRHPATAYGIAAVLLLILAFLGAISISKIYWGYWLSKPKLLPEAGLIAAVNEVCVFKTERNASGIPVAILNTNYTFAASIESGPKYGDDSFERILVALRTRRLLPPDYSTNMALLPKLYSIIFNSGMLVKSDRDYNSSAELDGIAVEATEKDGTRCLFVGMTGGQVSNDHYPNYELYFREDIPKQTWNLVHGQHYFYDVAGMEGAEWPAIGILLSIVLLPLGLGIFTVGRFVVRKRSDRRA